MVCGEWSSGRVKWLRWLTLWFELELGSITAYVLTESNSDKLSLIGPSLCEGEGRYEDCHRQ